jgi:hypothetical protein
VYETAPASSESGRIQTGDVKTDALTARKKRQIAELGLKESQFRGASALDSRILEKLHANNTLREGTYPKDPRNPYFLLMKAVADGKFPKRGSQIPRFLEAIEGGETESAKAMEILKAINSGTGPLVEKKQAKYLEELDGARAQDTVDEAKKAAAEAVSNVEISGEKADTSGKVMSVDEALKPKAERERDRHFKIGNWEVDPLRKGLVEELKDLNARYGKTSKRYISAYKECEKAVDELNAPGLEASKKESLTTKIHNLEQTKAAIEREMDQIQAEALKAREEYENWVTQTLKKFQKFETVLAESGIDLRLATNLTTKKYGEVKVTKVYFDKLDLEDSVPKEGEMNEAIGQLMIEFEDETGEKFSVSHTNFFSSQSKSHIVFQSRNSGKFYRLIRLQSILNNRRPDIHEQIASMDELNHKIAVETHYKPLEVGDKFEAKVITGFDKNGEEIYGTQEFTIESIENSQGEPVIVLDRTVTAMEKERLSPKTQPALYFDRKQERFSPGEFAKFVKQHSFKRVLTPQDDLQTIADGAYKTQKRTMAELGLPLAGLTALTLPKPGEAPRKVVVYSDTGAPRTAFIKAKEDGEYELEALIPDDPTGPLEDMPSCADDIARVEGINPPSAKNSFRIERIPLSKYSNLESLDKGNIAGAAHGHGGDDEHGDVHEALQAMAVNDSTHPKHKNTAAEDADDEEALKERAARVSKPEALPYKEIYKAGGMNYPERGVLKRIWDDTTVLSFSDLWAMGKAGYDYYQRRWERRQKDKYSRVGEDIPFFGSEMRRIKQAAENEEVHQFHESFSQKGVFEIEERVRVTSNKDEMKACIEDLAEKGHVRWDDIEMWKNINRFVDDPANLIPIPSNGDPYTRVSAHDDRTGMDFLQGAIDSIWGESTYDHWFSKDKSTRQSGARSWYEKGKELEIIEGGHEKALENLLRKHRNGEFVDPQEYEGLILHMIDAGKSDMQPKIYYIVAGVTAENHHGHTILSFDRIGHINSEMLAQFPLLEYIAASPLRPDGKRHRWTKDDYKRWLAYFEKDSGPNHCRATKQVDHFMWRYIIPSYENETRCNKDLRNAEKLDHDDMFAYLPPASTKTLTNACKTVGGGGKHLLTIEGYANAAPGFSQYIKSLAHFKNINRFQQAVQSYVRFEAIMTNRWEKEDGDFARMDKNTLTRKSVASDIPPIVFFKQLNVAIKNVAQAYGDPELLEAVGLIQTDTEGWDMEDPGNKAKQRQIQMALERFDTTFSRVIASDNAQKAMEVVSQSTLDGMEYNGSHDDYVTGEAEPAGSELPAVGHGGHGHAGHH